MYNMVIQLLVGIHKTRSSDSSKHLSNDVKTHMSRSSLVVVSTFSKLPHLPLKSSIVKSK